VKPLRRLVRSVPRRLYFVARDTLRYARTSLRDARSNRRFSSRDRRFLVVRHLHNPAHYQIVLDWVEQKVPALRPLFELRLLPCPVRDWSRYALHIPWFPDPVQNWSQKAYEQANRLAAECDARGTPVINRVDRLTNAGKSTAARLIAQVGLRTPRMVPIENAEEFRETRLGLNLPLIVREDWGHGRLMIRVNEPGEVARVPLERFARPIAVEFIDVRSRGDGLCRKYRYLAAGQTGIPLHLHISREWVTRGNVCEYNPALRDEEIAYISGRDPHHDLLQRARQALGLDFIAFDYGYDHEGRAVIWEVNPYPYLHFPGAHYAHRRPALERALGTMVSLYLDRAALPVPAELGDRVHLRAA